jgi:hypothetical protein
MNYTNRNYTAIQGRGYVSATITNSDNREKQWKKMTQNKSDDAPAVSMETHKLMYWNFTVSPCILIH